MTTISPAKKTGAFSGVKRLRVSDFVIAFIILMISLKVRSRSADLEEAEEEEE